MHANERHSTDFASTSHGNGSHSTPFAPLDGATFTGVLLSQARFEVSFNDFRYTSARTDADGAQPTLRIYNSGTQYIYKHTSSAAWKDDITDADDRLAEAVLQLRPVSFVPKGGPNLKEAEPADHRNYGLLAEEVIEILPEVCSRDDDGKPSYVSYDLLSVAAIAAIQQLAARVEQLEAQKTT